MKFDIYQTVTDKILAQLETGCLPWMKPWQHSNAKHTNTMYPFNGSTGTNYKGINTLLLACNDYDSKAWYTYKQARELGGSVIKGAKSTMIVFWQFIEKHDGQGNIQERIPFLKYYNVFNYEQCEGLPEPKQHALEVITTPLDAIPALLGVSLAHGGNRAFYSPSNDAITMPVHSAFESQKFYDATLLHELTHATGHETRCARDFKGRFGSESYAFEELIAELGSAFLGMQLDIEPVLQHNASYIASWVKVLQGDKKAIITASSQAQKACEFVLNVVKPETITQKELAA